MPLSGSASSLSVARPTLEAAAIALRGDLLLKLIEHDVGWASPERKT